VEYLWWTLTIILMILGLIGAVFPVWPDSLLIWAGALLHHFTVRAEHTVGWWTLAVLTLLMILAHVVDFTAGAIGSKKFGGTRWGAAGGIIGGIIGVIFFFPIGIFLGPMIGVLCMEVVFAGRTLGPAAKSSWGTLLGTTAGIIGKAIIDVSMVVIFFGVIAYNSGWLSRFIQR
jgi:uncharacterized protein YqgC (DUF456 family)